MKTKIKAIVISETNYSESSKILNLLTEDKGIIGVISRGCRKMNSPLRAGSSKLCYGYFYMNYKEDKLSTLTEIDIINDFKNIKTDLNKIGCTAFLIDLATGVSKESFTEEVFSILEQALIKIEEGFDPLIITNIVELKYLKFLGVSPVLNCCSKCGSKSNIVTINSDSGGYLCNNCHTNEYIVDEKTIKLFRMFDIVDLSKIKELNIKDINKKEINSFLEDYYTRYTGLYLKSKDFLNRINDKKA